MGRTKLLTWSAFSSDAKTIIARALETETCQKKRSATEMKSSKGVLHGASSRDKKMRILKLLPFSNLQELEDCHSYI